MKKLIIITLLLMSCNGPDYIEGDAEGITNGSIRYFKDTRTGLCFAEKGTLDIYSFTCVPCDSLKNIDKIFNNKQE